MSSPPPTPIRGEPGAPSFDSRHLHELRRYFCDLEYLFSRSRIIDLAEQKLLTTHFVDFATWELWQAIPEYSDTTVDFASFRVAVFSLYPEVDDTRHYRRADLERIVEEQSHHAITTLAGYGEYYRRFLIISTFLRSCDRLASFNQSHAFMQGFDPTLRQRIESRLAIVLPYHDPDDPYPLPDVDCAVRWLLCTSPMLCKPPANPVLPLREDFPVSSPAPPLPTTPAVDAKPEPTEELVRLAHIFTDILRLREKSPVPIGSPSPPVELTASSLPSPPLPIEDQTAARLLRLEKELFALRLERGEYEFLVREPAHPNSPAPRRVPAPLSRTNSSVPCRAPVVSAPPPVPAVPPIVPTRPCDVSQLPVTSSATHTAPRRLPVASTPLVSVVPSSIIPARPAVDPQYLTDPPVVHDNRSRSPGVRSKAAPTSYSPMQPQPHPATSSLRNSTIPRPIDTPLPSPLRWHPAYLSRPLARKSDQERLVHSRHHAEACQARAARRSTSRAAVSVISARREHTIRSADDSNKSPRADRDEPYRFTPNLDVLSAPKASHSTHSPSIALTSHNAAISRPLVSVFHSVDVQRRCYPSISRDRESDRWNRLCEPVIDSAPVDHTAPRTAPDSHSIVPAPRSFDVPHRSYQESPLARESDHGEEIREPDSVVVPRAHAVRSPSACAAVTVTPECRERSESITIESSASLDATRSVAKEFSGVFSEVWALGEHPVPRDPSCLVSVPSAIACVPVMSRTPQLLSTLPCSLSSSPSPSPIATPLCFGEPAPSSPSASDSCACIAHASASSLCVPTAPSLMGQEQSPASPKTIPQSSEPLVAVALLRLLFIIAVIALFSTAYTLASAALTINLNTVHLPPTMSCTAVHCLLSMVAAVLATCALRISSSLLRPLVHQLFLRRKHSCYRLVGPFDLHLG